MNAVQEALEAAADSEDYRHIRYGSPKHRANSPKRLARLLRRVLENVDGETTVNELIQQLDEAIE